MDRLFPVRRYEGKETGEQALVWTELFLREVSQHQDYAILHFWPLEKTVILGQMDTQLPEIKAGLQTIKDASYQALIRTMGGLAIVADEGVLNVTLTLPIPDGYRFDFHQSYQLMVDLLAEALADVVDELEVEEVATSYCPGKYDVSIGGRKFAGLAQRLYQKAIGVSAYISLTGSQWARCQLISSFYKAGLAGEQHDRYPRINPDKMATLSDLLGRTITVEEMKARLEQALQERGHRLEDYYPKGDNLSDLAILTKESEARLAKYGLGRLEDADD